MQMPYNKIFAWKSVTVLHTVLTCASAVTLCFSACVAGCAGTGTAEVLCAGGAAAAWLSETGQVMWVGHTSLHGPCTKKSWLGRWQIIKILIIFLHPQINALWTTQSWMHREAGAPTGTCSRGSGVLLTQTWTYERAWDLASNTGLTLYTVWPKSKAGDMYKYLQSKVDYCDKVNILSSCSRAMTWTSVISWSL